MNDVVILEQMLVRIDIGSEQVTKGEVVDRMDADGEPTVDHIWALIAEILTISCAIRSHPSPRFIVPNNAHAILVANAQLIWGPLGAAHEDTNVSTCPMSSDPRVTLAFRELDKAILDKECRVLPRLALCRLVDIFEPLERLINRDRHRGLFHREGKWLSKF
jgi:hypothetical protein